MIKHPSEKKESNKLSVGKYFFSLYTRKLTRQNLTFSKNNENNSKNKSDNSFRPPSVFELNHLAKSSSGSNLPWLLNQQYSTPISTIIYSSLCQFLDSSPANLPDTCNNHLLRIDPRDKNIQFFHRSKRSLFEG